MKHQEARELFSDYRDGVVSDDQKEALEAHLEQCGTCLDEWLDFSRTLDEVSGLLPVLPKVDVTRAVERRIHRRSGGKFFGRSSNIQFAVVSFVLVLLFMLAYLLMVATNEVALLEQPSDNGAVRKSESSANIALPSP